MSRWIVAIESRAPGETTPLPNPAAQRTKLMRALADHSCEVGVSSNSWSVTIEVDDRDVGDIRRVTEIGFDHITAASATTAMDLWPIVKIEATRLDLASEAAIPILPDVVGVAEVLKILNISKQYFGQLRTTGRFPDPLFELKESPIWARAAVEEFAATHRPSARPPMTAPTASTVRRIGSQSELVAKKRGPQLAPIPGGTNLRGKYNLKPIVKP